MLAVARRALEQFADLAEYAHFGSFCHSSRIHDAVLGAVAFLFCFEGAPGV